MMSLFRFLLIAAEMARTRPDRVRRIVMISAPIFTAAELAAYRAGLAQQPTPLPQAFLDSEQAKPTLPINRDRG